MAEEINVGDLVMMVKPLPCCGDASFIGNIYTVTGFHDAGVCAECGIVRTPCAFLDNEYKVQPVSALKKINPPPIKESIEREVTA